jgi:hypothetical protein
LYDIIDYLASPKSETGHSRRRRPPAKAAAGKPDHIRCAAERGNKFSGSVTDVIQAPSRSLESCATNLSDFE